MKPRPQGFTLLEILIALALFSLLGIMAYGGLRSLQTAQTVVSEHSVRAVEVQRALEKIRQDLEQTQNFLWVAQTNVMQLNANGLAFTRGGINNPRQLARSELQWVRYQLQDGTLTRESTQVMSDPELQNEPAKQKLNLLSKVKRVQWRFLEPNNQWQTQWPPSSTTSALPRAIELNLETEDWGELRVLMRVVPANGELL